MQAAAWPAAAWGARAGVGVGIGGVGGSGPGEVWRSQGGGDSPAPAQRGGGGTQTAACPCAAPALGELRGCAGSWVHAARARGGGAGIKEAARPSPRRLPPPNPAPNKQTCTTHPSGPPKCRTARTCCPLLCPSSPLWVHTFHRPASSPNFSVVVSASVCRAAWWRQGRLAGRARPLLAVGHPDRNTLSAGRGEAGSLATCDVYNFHAPR